MNTPETFRQLVAALAEQITRQLSGRPLTDAVAEELALWLNGAHGPTSLGYQTLAQACRDGVAAGWLCNREGGGIRYGRIFKPADDLQGFSVDVVDMENIAGPHHTHPHGEIDLIMPTEGTALFDDHPAGWCVYPAGSAHHPTVSHGRALVLYLLPQGAIEFTRA